MNNTTVTGRPRVISQDWMVWLALRHFLSAHLQRELAATVVTAAGYSMSDLFEEVLKDEELWSECWIVRPRKSPEPAPDDSARQYFVRMVESIVAQNDLGGAPYPEEEQTQSQNPTPGFVDLVVRMGAVDLRADLEAWESAFEGKNHLLQPSFKAFLKALRIAKLAIGAPDPWPKILPEVESVDMPLRAILTKHIADMLADDDNWCAAKIGYDRVTSLLDQWEPEVLWQNLKSAWQSSVTGSVSSALSIIHETPKEAATLLKSAVTRTLDQDPILVANLTSDASFTASHPHVEGHKYSSREFFIMTAPLLVASHNGSVPVELTRRGHFDAAGRRFWALLRRQLSLGAANASRWTKAAYARSLVLELSAAVGKQENQGTFNLAARMLIESGEVADVERLTWPAQLLAVYLNEECVNELILHVDRHVGGKISRGRVLVKLFTAWASQCRAPTAHSAIILMWHHVATLARKFPAAPHSPLDLGRPSLLALTELARRRPELRKTVDNAVVQAICDRLTSGEDFWQGRGDACDTATAYADVLSSEALAQVVRAVLRMLSTIELGLNQWLLIRPALAFLVSKPTKDLAKRDPQLGGLVVSEILRIGLEQESERRNIIFYLNDFDNALLSTAEISNQLHESGIIRELLDQASEHSSSRVGNAISALLLAPTVSGRAGVEVALRSLHEVLVSAKAPHPSEALAMAYTTLLDLINSKSKLEEALPNDQDWLDSQYRSLCGQIPGVWRAAAHRPTILATFSLPPPRHSNPVIVHNWAVATLRFGDGLEQTGMLDDVMRSSAADAPELARPIALARETRAMSRPIELSDVERVKTDDPESFYANIGRHLVQLRRGSGQERSECFCKALVSQCIRFGPRVIDAAVFWESTSHPNLREYLQSYDLSDYRLRLATEPRELQLTLSPILELLGDPAPLPQT